MSYISCNVLAGEFTNTRKLVALHKPLSNESCTPCFSYNGVFINSKKLMVDQAGNPVPTCEWTVTGFNRNLNAGSIEITIKNPVTTVYIATSPLLL